MPVGRTRHTLTIEQNSKDLRFGAQGVVSGEHGLARGAEVSIHGHIGQRGFFRLRIGLGALALFGHERIKTLPIHTQTRFLGNLQREVNGKAIRVVKQERRVTSERRGARFLRLRHRDIEDARSRLQGLQERFLFRESEGRHSVILRGNLGIGSRHRISGGLEQRSKTRLMHAQEPHRANTASQKSPQNVPTTIVGGNHAIGHQHQRRADVIRNDAHPNVIVMVGPIGAT